jgi:hypothetical protein
LPQWKRTEPITLTRSAKTNVFAVASSDFERRYKPPPYQLVSRIRVTYQLAFKEINMQESFRTVVSSMKKHPLVEETDFLGGVAQRFDAFAHAVEASGSCPSLIIAQGAQFGMLVPECLHTCPAFVMWLPSEFSEDIQELAHATPFAYGRTSPDLRQRDLMLAWGTSNFTFASFATNLLPGIRHQRRGGAIPMIFATSSKAAVTALPVNTELLDNLNHIGSQCGQNFNPRKEFSGEWLKAASKRRRDPMTFELDPLGRPVVLLRTRAAPRTV